MLKRTGHRQAERGQVLPMWIVGTITTLALSFLVMNYANAVRWQIRVQNDADATAAAMVAAQASEYNQMIALLYASSVEEFRIRTLLDGILLAYNQSGGCNGPLKGNPIDSNGKSGLAAHECNRVYTDLKSQFALSVQRYTNDILMLHSITFQLNQAGVTASANYAMGYNSFWCSSDQVTIQNWSGGGDCGVKYTLDAIKFRKNLISVNHDGANSLVSGLGRYSTTGTSFGSIHDTENPSSFAPVSVDVVTCVKVPPIVPNFGPFHWPTYYTIGRAAATAAQVDEDFLSGIQCYNNCGSSTTTYNIGNEEDYTPTTVDTINPTNWEGLTWVNWYDVRYGANAYTPNPSVPAWQDLSVNADEFTVQMGWWGSVPVAPFGPAVNTSTSC